MKYSTSLLLHLAPHPELATAEIHCTDAEMCMITEKKPSIKM